MPDVIDYHAVLADLRARRARYDVLIAGIEALIVSGLADGPMEATLGVPVTGDPVSVAPAAPEIHADTFFNLSIIDAVKKFLRMAGRAQHARAIGDALERGGLRRPGDNVLSGILVRAAKGREITKVGKGTWGLSEWYPKPRSAEPTAKAPSKPKPAPKAKRAKKPDAWKRSADRPPALKISVADDRSMNGHTHRGALSETLREALGLPKNVQDITNEINVGGRAVSRRVIESMLNRWVREGKARKTAPGTFAAL